MKAFLCYSIFWEAMRATLPGRWKGLRKTSIGRGFANGKAIGGRELRGSREIGPRPAPLDARTATNTA